MEKGNDKFFDCDCCGAKGTVQEVEKGGFGVCRICGWEDNTVQLMHPDWDAGPNPPWSLEKAREAWKRGKTLFKQFPNPADK